MLCEVAYMLVGRLAFGERRAVYASEKGHEAKKKKGMVY